MLPTRATKGRLVSWRSGPRAAVVSGLATLVLVLALGECVISRAPWAPEAFSRNELPVPGLLGDYFPNQDGQLVLPDAVPPHSYRFTTNAEGYRGPLVAEQKPEGSFRVLALGDSYTWGDGVDDGTEVATKYDPLNSSNFPLSGNISGITIDRSNLNSDGVVVIASASDVIDDVDAALL